MVQEHSAKLTQKGHRWCVMTMMIITTTMTDHDSMTLWIREFVNSWSWSCDPRRYNIQSCPTKKGHGHHHWSVSVLVSVPVSMSESESESQVIGQCHSSALLVTTDECHLGHQFAHLLTSLQYRSLLAPDRGRIWNVNHLHPTSTISFTLYLSWYDMVRGVWSYRLSVFIS